MCSLKLSWSSITYYILFVSFVWLFCTLLVIHLLSWKGKKSCARFSLCSVLWRKCVFSSSESTVAFTVLELLRELFVVSLQYVRKYFWSIGASHMTNLDDQKNGTRNEPSATPHLNVCYPNDFEPVCFYWFVF